MCAVGLQKCCMAKQLVETVDASFQFLKRVEKETSVTDDESDMDASEPK